jgi:signal transduction histidine kinase
MMHGLRQMRRKSPSLQLDLMVVGTFSLMLLISVWSWTVLSDNAGKLLLFSEIFSEESLAFSMRLFVVAALALLLISANGYGLERLVSLNSTVTDQMVQSDQLNQQLNTLLNEKNEMLQVLSFAARSENLPAIMSSLAHEINQPLGAIRLNADFLLAEDASLSAPQREQLLHQLVNCSNAATQVVRDFRRFLETHLTPHVKVDVSQLLSDLVRGFHGEFHRQCVQVEMHADEDVAVQGDPVQLESALTGLLLYMIKRNSPHVRQLEITAKCIGRFVHMRLIDNGPPISSHQLLQALVYRPADKASHDFNQSLWLSRAIIEHHGGAMSVHESPGQTGIHLQLPTLEQTS